MTLFSSTVDRSRCNKCTDRERRTTGGGQGTVAEHCRKRLEIALRARAERNANLEMRTSESSPGERQRWSLKVNQEVAAANGTMAKPSQPENTVLTMVVLATQCRREIISKLPNRHVVTPTDDQ